MNDRFKFRVWNNCDCSKDFGKVYYDAQRNYGYDDSIIDICSPIITKIDNAIGDNDD